MSDFNDRRSRILHDSDETLYVKVIAAETVGHPSSNGLFHMAYFLGGACAGYSILARVLGGDTTFRAEARELARMEPSLPEYYTRVNELGRYFDVTYLRDRAVSESARQIPDQRSVDEIVEYMSDQMGVSVSLASKKHIMGIAKELDRMVRYLQLRFPRVVRIRREGLAAYFERLHFKIKRKGIIEYLRDHLRLARAGAFRPTA